MFSRFPARLRQSLALRLTAWYAGVFAISSMLAFAVSFALIVDAIHRDFDGDLVEDLEEFSIFLQLGGLEKVKEEMSVETAGHPDQVFFRLWTSPHGAAITTDLSDWEGLSNRTPLPTADQPIFQTLQLPQRDDRVRTAVGIIGPSIQLQIGESMDEVDGFVDELLRGFLLTVLAVALLGAPIGWFLARRALRGVQAITRVAVEIAAGSLDRRVAVGTQGHELDTLAAVFNRMLDQIQALLVSMREMTDNLAHDFRSPLARIRASAEMVDTEHAQDPDLETMVATTTEECDRLLTMINTTLDIAETESGARPPSLTHVDLVAVVNDALELFESVAEDKAATLQAQLPGQCQVRGDRQQLQRVVANLLDNALKYLTSGGQVEIRLADDGEQVSLAFQDSGVGIDDHDKARIFERFYRGERSRSAQGNGLGLSLALAYARAHGGNITVEDAPTRGSTFTVTLPHRYFLDSGTPPYPGPPVTVAGPAKAFS